MGLFTIYLLIAGYRGLRFRQTNPSLEWDKRLALALGITGLVWITFPILLYQKINVISTVFGVVCLYFGLSDLRMLRRPQVLQKRWLYIHLGKTIGAYLASVTAFVVVNNVFAVPMYNWFGPSIIGTLYIVYWNRKLKKNNRIL
jgi:accessory gene regulator protein AgrB